MTVQDKKNSLKLNVAMNMLLTMSSFIFPLITFPYVSRVLGPEGVGKVTWGTSVIAYFNLFAQLGIPTYGIRACAEVRDDRAGLSRTAQELLFINFIMAALSYVLLILGLFTIPKLREERTLFLVISSTIFLAAVGMEWMYRGLEQYTYITIRSLIFKILSVAAMFLLVHAPKDYVIYGAVTVLASSASYLFNLIYAGRFIDWKPAAGFRPQRHMKAVLIFFLMSCATTVYTNLDTVMLGFLKTDADVGYYNAAVRVKNILVSVVYSVCTVLMPRASYELRNGRKARFQEYGKKAFRFVLLFSVPVTVFFILYTLPVICFLASELFLQSVLPMQVILPTVILIGFSNILGLQILVPLGMEKLVLYSELTGALVDFFLNLLLIPRYSAVGAAAATVVAELAVLLVQIAGFQRSNEWFCSKLPWKTVAAGTLLGALAAVPALRIPSDLVSICVGGAVFFSAYLIVLFAAQEPTVAELWKVLRNRFRRM